MLPLGDSARLPSVADHQANERTFLAWLRTAIALMGFGFVIAKFGLFLRVIMRTGNVPTPFSSGLIGIALVVAGGAMALVAAIRYQTLQRKIDLGTYAPGKWPMWIASATLTVLALLLVVYLFETAWR
jgi:putative membrane protein